MRENKQNPYTSARSMETYGSMLWPAANITAGAMGQRYPGEGYMLPAYAVAALLAAVTKTRTAYEQAAWDDNPVMKYLNFVPGVGIYNKLKRAGFDDAKQWAETNKKGLGKTASINQTTNAFDMNNVRRLKNELIRISNHTAMEKRAFDLSKSIGDAWTGLKNKWDKLDPDTRKNMITALGALGGGAIGYGLSGNPLGAGIGAGMGGLGAYGLQNYYDGSTPEGSKKKTISKVVNKTVASNKTIPSKETVPVKKPVIRIPAINMDRYSARRDYAETHGLDGNRFMEADMKDPSKRTIMDNFILFQASQRGLPVMGHMHKGPFHFNINLYNDIKNKYPSDRTPMEHRYLEQFK